MMSVWSPRIRRLQKLHTVYTTLRNIIHDAP